MMSASHDEAHLEVPKAHESVDSRGNVAGGHQMSPTILPTRRRRGRGTPAPAALDRLITDNRLGGEAQRSVRHRGEAQRSMR